MKRASARSRPNATNAASISAGVLALKNRASNPSARCFLKRFGRGVSVSRIGWIDQHSVAGGLGQELMHEPEPLGVDFYAKKIDPSRVTAWSREARNDAQPHRVLSHAEHNRN